MTAGIESFASAAIPQDMTSRRRNLFVIALMLGLLVASVVIMITKETKLGLDLKGGVELVYQGEPTPQSKVTPEAIDRAIDIIRERVDRLGVAEPEIQRLGIDQISVGLPGVKNLERAKKQVGTTAQLLLYDWERNVLGNPPDARSRASTRRSSARPSSNRSDRRQQHHDRHLLPLQAEQAARGRPGLVARGPAVRVRREGSQGLRDPEGARRAPWCCRAERPENLPPTRPSSATSSCATTRRCAAPTSRTRARRTTRRRDEPIVTFKFTDKGRKNFQEVTRRLAERGQTRQIPGQPVESSFQTFAIVLDREVVSRPFIDYRENPDGIDGRTGAQISGGFSSRRPRTSPTS